MDRNEDSWDQRPFRPDSPNEGGSSGPSASRRLAALLESRGIGDRRVLEAVAEVPRHEFVPDGLRQAAYDDTALPIGHGQTISQPFTVAFMIEALQLDGHEKVLEIGTGSGYGAAVLSRAAREVFTLERIPELAQKARERLERFGYANVRVFVSDGTLGLEEAAPFDAIVVTAGAEALPQAFVNQLAEGGRIVIPLGKHPHSQTMYRFTLRDGKLKVDELGAFAFVPLIGEHGWSEGETAGG